MKQYDGIRKVSTGQGDDYTMVICRILLIPETILQIAIDLSKQKALDTDLRATQQIIFTGTVKTTGRIHNILEQPKDRTLEYYKETTKVL